MEINDLKLDSVRELQRELNSVEHKIYVTARFTRTTEVLLEIIGSLVQSYNSFFRVFCEVYFLGDTEDIKILSEKIKVVKEILLERSINLDLSEYFLLKKFLISDYERVGEYRKNLSLVIYVDSEKHVLNIQKLIEYFNNFKDTCKLISKLNMAANKIV